jgi:hypothetical protein
MQMEELVLVVRAVVVEELWHCNLNTYVVQAPLPVYVHCISKTHYSTSQFIFCRMVVQSLKEGMLPPYAL